MGITYSEAGVDVPAIRKSQESIGRLIQKTHLGSTTVHGFGHYAGLVDISDDRLLATHTDGVGTKAMIAVAMEKYDTIGIDCIAMNVNDVICVGASPISFVDYIAANRNEQILFEQIVKGLTDGAITSGVPIVGGETAIMPDLFAGDRFAFDLAGTVVGMVDRSRAILGEYISTGDIIVGARSSGLHSNGYTLARKALSKYSVYDRVRGVGCIGDALLEPTRIYVRPVLDILSRCKVHGLAHITGGSFAKMLRLADVGFDIDYLPPTPPIMDLIAAQGVDDIEMYRTFNMGVGFCVVAPASEADDIQTVFSKYGIETDLLGKITERRGVRVGPHTLA